MVGVLLEVPELRQQLKDLTEGGRKSGDVLARIIADWVQGRPLPEMAREHFRKNEDSDSVKMMTQCCRDVFGRITQTASWGLAALQSLTMEDTLESMSADEQRTLRNLPAWVYYGVNSDEAVALRLLGVPRAAAAPLAAALDVTPSELLNDTRGKLRASTTEAWRDALGKRGESYYRVWSIIEGN